MSHKKVTIFSLKYFRSFSEELSVCQYKAFYTAPPVNRTFHRSITIAKKDGTDRLQTSSLSSKPSPSRTQASRSQAGVTGNSLALTMRSVGSWLVMEHREILTRILQCLYPPLRLFSPVSGRINCINGIAGWAFKAQS